MFDWLCIHIFDAHSYKSFYCCFFLVKAFYLEYYGRNGNDRILKIISWNRLRTKWGKSSSISNWRHVLLCQSTLKMFELFPYLRSLYFNWKLFANFIFICSFKLNGFFTSALRTSKLISVLVITLLSVSSTTELLGWLCPTDISFTTLFFDNIRAVHPDVWFVHRQYMIPTLLKWNSYWFILNWALMLENLVWTYCNWNFGPFKMSIKLGGIKLVLTGLMRGRPLPRFGLSPENVSMGNKIKNLNKKNKKKINKN